MLLEHGVPVYRMSGKRTHDAAEVYDGVPSLHDAKSAAIIAKLHLDGFSRPWGLLSEEKRELKATMDLYREQHQRLIHSLESSLARYWPELTEHLELSSATLVALLARVGGPHDVADALEQSRGLLHGMSHGLMSQETNRGGAAERDEQCGREATDARARGADDAGRGGSPLPEGIQEGQAGRGAPEHERGGSAFGRARRAARLEQTV
jgi:hypothetical protein